ncbi:MAG TPA: hypothetical protein PLO41_18575 [Rubrivivax sp.]|nr:hypothetical protein [Rubrivivax sp.]
MNLDPSVYVIGVGAVALIGGFSARRYGWGVGLMYAGVITLLGTLLWMIVAQTA